MKIATASPLSRPASNVFSAFIEWKLLMPNRLNEASIRIPMAPPK